MLKIGIIGAGSISKSHFEAYNKNNQCKVVAVADINETLAQKRADEYGVEKVYTDYKELLADGEIDAVSIVTPTFTHKNIVIEALKNGKNVLCEKPPALTADDIKECIQMSEKSGKLLMYAFVCRFREQTQYLKHYIDSGKMGSIVYAEGNRISRCTAYNGWLCDATKCGGFLLDSGIHELDLILYLMGYPKPKTILGYTSKVNSNLPQKIKSQIGRYVTSDTNEYERTIESFAGASIIFDNGSYVTIKAASVLNKVDDGVSIDICGEKSGAKMEPFSPGNELKMLEVTDDFYFNNTIPVLMNNDPFCNQINHFVDCCMNGTDCICKPEEAVSLLEIINAIYKSAECGKAIEF